MACLISSTRFCVSARIDQFGSLLVRKARDIWAGQVAVKGAEGIDVVCAAFSKAPSRRLAENEKLLNLLLHPFRKACSGEYGEPRQHVALADACRRAIVREIRCRQRWRGKQHQKMGSAGVCGRRARGGIEPIDDDRFPDRSNHIPRMKITVAYPFADRQFRQALKKIPSVLLFQRRGREVSSQPGVEPAKMAGALAVDEEVEPRHLSEIVVGAFRPPVDGVSEGFAWRECHRQAPAPLHVTDAERFGNGQAASLGYRQMSRLAKGRAFRGSGPIEFDDTVTSGEDVGFLAAPQQPTKLPVREQVPSPVRQNL